MFSIFKIKSESKTKEKKKKKTKHGNKMAWKGVGM